MLSSKLEALRLQAREAALDQLIEVLGGDADNGRAAEVLDGGHRRHRLVPAGLGEERQAERERDVPGFVERELDGYLRCGRYEFGCARALDRFEERSDGRVTVRLKRPWRDGTTHVVLTPLQLVERLVALIPAPGVHMIRYHGAFAPNARMRSQLVPAPPTAEDAAFEEQPRCTHAGRQSYAFLIKRVFAREVAVCGRCGGRTKIDFVAAKHEIEQLPKSIGYPNAPGGNEASAA